MSLLVQLDNEWGEYLHQEREDEKGRPSGWLGMVEDTVGHHQASISEMLHLQQIGQHRGRHNLEGGAANDSDRDLLYTDSDKELHAVFDEESIDEDFLGFAEKL